ncbi:hypothetical protein [Streptomyces sp. NPDC054940]
MIAYAFLALGAAGTAGVLYAVAPAGRGLHRYVVPRSVLRAEAAQAEANADELAAHLVSVCTEREELAAERDEALGLLGRAELLVADLEGQLKAFDSTCAENSRLRSELANATAIRPLSSGHSPADDASALPDELQEFVSQTAATWRAHV